MGPAVVLDVRGRGATRFSGRLGGVEDGRSGTGRFPSAIVLLRTGWASSWPRMHNSIGIRCEGKIFPGFSSGAANC